MQLQTMNFSMISLICFQEPTLYTVKAVLILDNDGERLYAKVCYFRLNNVYLKMCSLSKRT